MLAGAAVAIQQELTGLTLTGINVNNGMGQLLDAPVGSTTLDHQSDAVKGNWTWTVPVGKTTADIPSTFTGSRAGTTTPTTR